MALPEEILQHTAVGTTKGHPQKKPETKCIIRAGAAGKAHQDRPDGDLRHNGTCRFFSLSTGN